MTEVRVVSLVLLTVCSTSGACINATESRVPSRVARDYPAVSWIPRDASYAFAAARLLDLVQVHDATYEAVGAVGDGSGPLRYWLRNHIGLEIDVEGMRKAGLALDRSAVLCEVYGTPTLVLPVADVDKLRRFAERKRPARRLRSLRLGDDMVYAWDPKHRPNLSWAIVERTQSWLVIHLAGKASPPSKWLTKLLHAHARHTHEHRWPARLARAAALIAPGPSPATLAMVDESWTAKAVDVVGVMTPMGVRRLSLALGIKCLGAVTDNIEIAVEAESERVELRLALGWLPRVRQPPVGEGPTGWGRIGAIWKQLVDRPQLRVEVAPIADAVLGSMQRACGGSLQAFGTGRVVVGGQPKLRPQPDFVGAVTMGTGRLSKAFSRWVTSLPASYAKLKETSDGWLIASSALPQRGAHGRWSAIEPLLLIDVGGRTLSSQPVRRVFPGSAMRRALARLSTKYDRLTAVFGYTRGRLLGGLTLRRAAPVSR